MLKNKPVYLIHSIYFLAPFVVLGLSLVHKTLAILAFWTIVYTFGLALYLFPFTILILFLIAYFLDKWAQSRQPGFSFMCFVVGLTVSSCLFIAHSLLFWKL